jgi:hypothetical protein
MTSDTETMTPVPVHVASSAVPMGAHHPPRLRISTFTRTLAAAGNLDLVPDNPAREYLLLQVIGTQTVVLCSALSQAQDPANTTVGLPNPNGSVLATGIVIPVKANNRLWIAAPAAAQVSVIEALRL